MRGCRIDVKTVCLKTGEVHRLGRATRHDQKLFRRETLLYLLTNVVAYAWVVLIWNIDLTFDEVEPCPKRSSAQSLNVSRSTRSEPSVSVNSFSQELDEPVNG